MPYITNCHDMSIEIAVKLTVITSTVDQDDIKYISEFISDNLVIEHNVVTYDNRDSVGNYFQVRISGVHLATYKYTKNSLTKEP